MLLASWYRESWFETDTNNYNNTLYHNTNIIVKGILIRDSTSEAINIVPKKARII